MFRSVVKTAGQAHSFHAGDNGRTVFPSRSSGSDRGLEQEIIHEKQRET